MFHQIDRAIQMKKRSIGVKRIIIILSVISAIVWVLVIGVVSSAFTDMGGVVGWLILAVGIFVAYFATQLICKVVYWVLDGFKTAKIAIKEADTAFKLAESEIAQNLGYQLCRCTWPPQIMLSIEQEEHGEKFQCPKCKSILSSV